MIFTKCNVEKLKMLYTNLMDYDDKGKVYLVYDEMRYTDPNKANKTLWINGTLILGVRYATVTKLAHSEINRKHNKHFILIGEDHENVVVDQYGKIILESNSLSGLFRKIMEYRLKVDDKNTNNSDWLLCLGTVDGSTKILQSSFSVGSGHYDMSVLYSTRIKKILTEKRYSEILEVVIPSKNDKVYEQYTRSSEVPWYKIYDNLRNEQASKVGNIAIGIYPDKSNSTGLGFDILDTRTGQPLENTRISIIRGAFLIIQRAGQSDIVLGIRRYRGANNRLGKYCLLVQPTL